MTGRIDIARFDRAWVLMRLFNAASPRGNGRIVDAALGTVTMTHAQAACLLESAGEQLYFDYLNGRVLKIDLSGRWMRVDLYDRDNGGPGSAALALGLSSDIPVPLPCEKKTSP